MRITELLEGKTFKDIDFVKVVDDSGKKELAFDLPDDLSFFMQNNDEAYRKHLHPVIVKCMSIVKRNKKPASSLFKNAVSECYEMYLKEFPIRELPNSLDEDLHNQICDKLREEVYTHIKDGKYE